MKYSSFIVVFLLLNVFNSMSGQNQHHHRSVLNRTEKWKPGRIDDILHVVDSFFYENGILKEVAESIIKRERFLIVDSIAVNQRKIMDKEGNLILEENFQDGQIIAIKSCYPQYLNLIPNGSFEQHSEIPLHTIEKVFVGRVRCKPIDSIVKTDTLHIDISGNDTTRHFLITRETRSNCDFDSSRTLNQYVLIEKNRDVVDSIYVKMPYSVHKGSYIKRKAHICNYEDVEIKVPGWKSLGRQFPYIYTLENNAPHSPLWGIADKIFVFNGIAGNSFVKLSSTGWWAPNCNPYYSHPLLQTTLNSTMSKGDKYSLEFWLWKPYSYPKGCSLNISFSELPVTMDNNQDYIKSMINVKAFNDSTTGQWQKVTLSFKAPEFARYMTIGFFNTSTECKLITQSDTLLSRWCYLDGFVLIAEDHKDEVLPNFQPNTTVPLENVTKDEPIMIYNHQIIEKDSSIVLENILFEIDSSNLLPESLSALRKLQLLLEMHPEISIKICGHSDDTGSEEYNKQLSDKRAKAVVLKLIEFGIDANRLSWEGYGSSVPVNDNRNEEGRAKNRRVEFVVL
ncbi:MAG TPA: OmpA family protein [Edaphocola sp.]|nr:OmpA family protein [Edaphocola sp.]